MSARPKAFVVKENEGRHYRGPVGGPALIKAGTDETAGSFAFLEVRIPPDQGPPLHLHRREDEMWYVLAGDFRFRADDDLLDAPQGSFIFMPRGTRHCFQNLSDREGRLLVMFTPSGMERWFEAQSGLALPFDPEEYRRISHDNWMEVAGPPLRESHPR